MAEIDGTSPIGEIVEVSTVSFTAQCLADPRPPAPCLFDPPDFGSFVKIGWSAERGMESRAVKIEVEEEDPFAAPVLSARPEPFYLAPNITFALVCHAQMSSFDSTRRASALGYPSEAELLAHQPQLAELITTEFSGLLVAFTDPEGCLHRHLPARPPKIHARVGLCQPDETRVLTADLSFLRPLLASASGSISLAPQNELVAAALRTAWSAHGRSQAYLLEAGKKLLELLSDDYDRLQAIIESVL
ncbi:MAG TPA: hypothetical protein VFW40_07615 [Capsulimonadaceae bacterium]|nr:hypothetical protein [Capsulimonadaceae bacterium]